MHAQTRPAQGVVKALVPLPGMARPGRPQPAALHPRKPHAAVTVAPKAFGAAPMFPSQTGKIEDGPAPSTSGRKIVFAVDGTADAEEGLRWLVKQVARKGDTIHLAHVICNPRTPSTAVGSFGVGTQWAPSRDEAVFAREFMLRLEHEAQTMMAARFEPSLQFTGVKHEVDLLRLRVHKSAASIGEALSQRAGDVGADMLVIASHGAGVLADYGSVARWCSENSPVPTLLLPPAVLAGAAPGAPPAPGAPGPSNATNAVVVAAVGDVSGLKPAFDYAVAQLTRPGDALYVLLARSSPDDDAAVALRKELVASAARWLEDSPAAHARTLNVAVDLVTEPASVPGGGMDPAAEGNGPAAAGAPSPAGERLCGMARELGARAVVLQHHGRSMMAEMMYGPVTLTVTKLCSRPLVVLGATQPLASSED